MSGKPIDIPIKIDADTDAGASQITDALEDIQDSLKDTEKAGEKTSKALEDDMSDAAKKIDRDLTKALDEVKDSSKSAGRAIGKNVKDGTDKAGEGLSDLKDESKSTAKEAAASFGSIEDAADALQEVVANAFVGFGPAGMAAGLVAAVGIGLAISALTDQADKINENKEKVLDLAQTIRDNGGVIKESDYVQAMEDFGYAIQDTKEFWEIFQKDAVSGFDQIRDQAEKAGVSLQDAFKGRFGSLEDSQKVLGSLEEKLADLESQTKGNVEMHDEFGRSLTSTDPAILAQISGTKELSDKVRAHIDELRAAAEIERIRKESIQGTTQAVIEDIEALEKRTDAVKGSINADLESIESTAALTESIATNGATLNKNTEAGRKNIRAVLDAASSYEDEARAALEAGTSTDVVTAKFNAQRDALVTRLMPAFGGSQSKARAYIDTILQTPKAVNTNVTVSGIPQAEAKVRAFTNVGRHIVVNFQTGATYSVDNYIQGMRAGVTVPVNFAARGKPGII